MTSKGLKQLGFDNFKVFCAVLHLAGAVIYCPIVATQTGNFGTAARFYLATIGILLSSYVIQAWLMYRANGKTTWLYLHIGLVVLLPLTLGIGTVIKATSDAAYFVPDTWIGVIAVTNILVFLMALVSGVKLISALRSQRYQEKNQILFDF